MSEVFSGARYTFGGLVVMTLWSLGMMEVVQWKLDYQADTDDAALMKVGPGPDANDADVRRYHELMDAMGE